MDMVVEGRYFVAVILIFLTMVKRSDMQTQTTCPVSCRLGYTCYRLTQPHGSTEPTCIPMQQYLRLMQGHDHVHTSHGIQQVSHQVAPPPHFANNNNRPQSWNQPSTITNFRSNWPSNNQPFEPPTGTNRREWNRGAGNHGHRSRNFDSNRGTNNRDSNIMVDPATGRRFAMVPIDGTGSLTNQRGPSETRRRNPGSRFLPSTTPEPSRIHVDTVFPSKFVGQDTLMKRLDGTTTNRVPSAEGFENHLTQPSDNPPASSRSEEPSPNNILNREKSVLDFIQTAGNNIKPMKIANENVIEPIEQVVSQIHNPIRQEASVPGISKKAKSVIDEFVLQPTSNQNQNTDIQLSLKDLDQIPTKAKETPTEASLLLAPVMTAESIGNVSALLKDDSGYHFMFYPRPGEGGFRVSVTKTGFCPRIPLPLQSRRCSVWCSSDRMCPHQLKCCPNGCALLCMPPGSPDSNST